MVDWIAIGGIAMAVSACVSCWQTYINRNLWRTAERQAEQARLQAEAANVSARCGAWIEARRVFSSKEFKKDQSSASDLNVNECIVRQFGDIRGAVIAMQRAVPADEWNSAPQNRDGRNVTKEEALDVCRGMCEVADLVEFGGLDIDAVLRAWGDPFRKTWIVLEPLVRFEQSNEIRDWPLLWGSFEKVGQQALDKFGWPQPWGKPK